VSTPHNVDSVVAAADAADAAETAAIIADIVRGLPPDDGPPAPASGAEPAVVLAPRGSAAEVVKTAEAAAEAARDAGAVPDARTEPPAPAAKEPEPDPRALMRIIERDAMLRDREAVLEKREREIAAREEAARQRRALDPDEFRGRLYDDPLEAVRSLGLEPSDVARALTAGVLGDKAPPELRSATETQRLRAELRRLKEEVQSTLRERDHEAERQRVRADVRDYAATATGRMTRGESKHPTVDAVAAEDAAYVESAIWDEIARDASERAGREPDGRPLTAAEAAARVEARWAKIAGARKPAGNAVVENVTQTAGHRTPEPQAPAQAPAAPPIPKNPSRSARRSPAYYDPQVEPDDDAMQYALDVLRGRAPGPKRIG